MIQICFRWILRKSSKKPFWKCLSSRWSLTRWPAGKTVITMETTVKAFSASARAWSGPQLPVSAFSKQRPRSISRSTGQQQTLGPREQQLKPLYPVPSWQTFPNLVDCVRYVTFGRLKIYFLLVNNPPAYAGRFERFSSTLAPDYIRPKNFDCDVGYKLKFTSIPVHKRVKSLQFSLADTKKIATEIITVWEKGTVKGVSPRPVWKQLVCSSKAR